MIKLIFISFCKYNQTYSSTKKLEVFFAIQEEQDKQDREAAGSANAGRIDCV